MSNVSFDEFSQKFLDEINVNIEDIKDKTLGEIPEYDSMGRINISLLIEELFNFQVEYDDLSSASTIENLYNMCLINKK